MVDPIEDMHAMNAIAAECMRRFVRANGPVIPGVQLAALEVSVAGTLAKLLAAGKISYAGPCAAEPVTAETGGPPPAAPNFGSGLHIPPEQSSGTFNADGSFTPRPPADTTKGGQTPHPD